MIIQIGTYKNETITFTGGTRSFTVSNFYETFTASNVKLITVNKPLTGTSESFVLAAPGMWKSTISNPSSGTFVVTYGSELPVLESGSTGHSIFIMVDIQDPTYDYSLNAQKTINETPEWSHYIDQYELYDVTNSAAATVRTVAYTESYKNHMFGVVGTVGNSGNTIIVTFQVPLKSTCVDTDDVNWKDVTSLLTGMNSIIITSGATSVTTPFSDVYFIDTDMIFERIMVKTVIMVVGAAAANTLTISHKMS